jgi:hypothetical protein
MLGGLNLATPNRLHAGQKINRLTFLRMTEKKPNDPHLVGVFECECGTIKPVMISRVVNGYAQSCGCLLMDNPGMYRHGMYGTRTYRSWCAMIQRCENPTSKDYHKYGAVGIRVCDRWKDFVNFYADMGERPLGTSIDRINGTRGYCLDNCRWANPEVQARNNRKFVVVNTPIGIMPLIDYSAKIGISNGAAHLRLKRGKLEGCVKI